MERVAEGETFQCSFEIKPAAEAVLSRLPPCRPQDKLRRRLEQAKQARQPVAWTTVSPLYALTEGVPGRHNLPFVGFVSKHVTETLTDLICRLVQREGGVLAQIE